MTIQQALFSRGSDLPEYVGFASTSKTNASTLSLAAPSAAQVGDLILIYGYAIATSGISWSASGITEVQDAGAPPNMFIGYKTLSSVGETYSLLLNATSTVLAAYSIAYRRAIYSAYSFVAPGAVTSANVSITPSVANSSIVGLVANYSHGTTWAFTETAPSATATINSGSNHLLFRKDTVTGALSYTFTGLNSDYRTQAALVSLRPV